MWECVRPFRTTKNRGGFAGGSVVKNPPASAGDMGLIPASGRSLGEGNGNLFWYSYLGITWTEEPGRLQSMGSQKSQRRLRDWTGSKGGGVTVRWHLTWLPQMMASLKYSLLGFPGGSLVKNPQANAGDTGSIPWSRKIPHAMEQLSPCTAMEPTRRSNWRLSEESPCLATRGATEMRSPLVATREDPPQ